MYIMENIILTLWLPKTFRNSSDFPCKYMYTFKI